MSSSVPKLHITRVTTQHMRTDTLVGSGDSQSDYGDRFLEIEST